MANNNLLSFNELLGANITSYVNKSVKEGIYKGTFKKLDPDSTDPNVIYFVFAVDTDGVHTEARVRTSRDWAFRYKDGAPHDGQDIHKEFIKRKTTLEDGTVIEERVQQFVLTLSSLGSNLANELGATINVSGNELLEMAKVTPIKLLATANPTDDRFNNWSITPSDIKNWIKKQEMIAKKPVPKKTPNKKTNKKSK